MQIKEYGPEHQEQMIEFYLRHIGDVVDILQEHTKRSKRMNEDGLDYYYNCIHRYGNMVANYARDANF